MKGENSQKDFIVIVLYFTLLISLGLGSSLITVIDFNFFAKLSPSSSLAKPNLGLSLVLILLPPAPTTQTSSENGQYKGKPQLQLS